MDNSKRNKIIINSIIIIFIGLICSIIIFGLTKDRSVRYLMIGDYLLWQKENNKWKQLNEIPEDFFKKEFTLYHGKSKNENIIIQNQNNNWYYFDKNYNQLNYEDFIGITYNLDVSFPNYKIEIADEMDSEYIEKALQKTKANNNGNYYTYKVELDFNNDGKTETLYTTTNYVLDVVNYNFKSLFYMVNENGKVQIIEENEMPYSFISVIDIDNDQHYEVIMGYNIKNLPTLDSCYKLYEIKDDKWELKQDCQNQ